MLIKTMLVAHALCAGVLVGSSTHLGLQSIAWVRGRGRQRLLRIYPPVAFLAWLFTFALGALIYPRYRVAVRFAVLDVTAVWASILFDVKENLAVFVGPLLGGAWWISRGALDDASPTVRRRFMACALASASIAWWNLVSGLLVASVKSV